MKTKTENKIILYSTLFYANFLIWNFAGAEFRDWKQDIAPGLAVVEEKVGLDGLFIPKMIYDSNLEIKTEIEADLDRREVKDNAEAVIASAEVVPQVEAGLVQSPKVEKTSEEYIKNKIEEVFGDKAEEAKLICGCESRYNHKIWGDTTTEFKSVGLFQIRELPKRMDFYGLTTEKLEDVDTNIEMAKIIYDKAGGWSPWRNCRNKYNL